MYVIYMSYNSYILCLLRTMLPVLFLTALSIYFSAFFFLFSRLESIVLNMYLFCYIKNAEIIMQLKEADLIFVLSPLDKSAVILR